MAKCTKNCLKICLFLKRVGIIPACFFANLLKIICSVNSFGTVYFYAILTIKKIISRDGISQEGNVTMDDFNGHN